jgi:hypothetical protein
MIGHHAWGRLLVLLLRLAGLVHTCSGLANIDAMASQLPRVDDVACVVVGSEPAAYQGAWSGKCRVGVQCGRSITTRSGWKRLQLVDRGVWLVQACPSDWAGGRVQVTQRGTLRLLHGDTLHQHPDVAVELLLLGVHWLGQVA